MAEVAVHAPRFRVPGLEVFDLKMHSAALRYFECEGAFAAAFSAAVRAALPAPLGAVRVSLPGEADGGGLLLAWMSPTQTLALSASPAVLAQLSAHLAGAAGGHVVDLSGGVRVLRLTGARSVDLLARLGGSSALRLHEARRGRMADVAVLAICASEGEVLLAVDRAYADHLLGWIEATLEDW